MIVDKYFLKNLKKAKEITIRSNGHYANIELILDGEYPNRVVANFELKEGIRIMHDYEKKYKLFETDTIPYSNCQALQYVLKENDEIIFFHEQNGNEYCKKAHIEINGESYDGINIDELCCRIIRKNKQIVNRFILSYSACPNNTARMVHL